MAVTTLRAAACAGELVRRHRSGPAAVTGLDGLSIEFSAGSFAEVIGPSGSGSSTLLHCLAGLDRPTSGRVRRMSRFNICTVPTGRVAERPVVGCGGPSRPAEPSHRPRCASRLFLGVRGSGEDPTQLLGMGSAVYAIFAGSLSRPAPSRGWSSSGASLVNSMLRCPNRES
jgi:energy-coupling factor transporter ATP-binding protein EcfA2